jgi:hypothetical protein
MAGVTTATTATQMAGVEAPTTAKSDTEPLPNRPATTATRLADNKRLQAKKRQAVESDSRPAGFSEDSSAKKTRPTRHQIEEAFGRFWAAYPRRAAKLAAAKAFAAAVKRGADPEALIAGAARYAAERAGQDPRYTKHPATWLNGDCWADEPPGGVVIDGKTGEPVAAEPSRPVRRSAKQTNLDLVPEILAENGNGPRR